MTYEIVLGVLSVGVLGIGGALISYLIRIENRLTRIETKISLN